MATRESLKQSAFSSGEITLGIYRICFGLLMCFSLIRFMWKGWVEACYLSTDFHFTYQYFHWISPVDNAIVMHALVALAALLALLVALGVWYRFSIISFFLLFTYLELIEKAWYLNHYYFVSIIAFLLCFIPADAALSLRPGSRKVVSVFYANVLRLQISIVYFFAGLAKLESDWLMHAQPLKIWLKTKTDIPIIGQWMAYDETAYLFSYGGALYDLGIPFLLLWATSRPYALLAVVGFHLMTALLFPIGMFPWIMIAGSLIFVTDQEWKKLFKFPPPSEIALTATGNSFKTVPSWLVGLFTLHFIVQIFLPIRPLFYAENQLWTERHYRFGWNVMLAEKTGITTFYLQDADNKKWVEYPNTQLSRIQEKQMTYQADMIWQYAHHLAQQYRLKGIDITAVYVDCQVSFNGRPSQSYLPETLNLLGVDQDNIYDHILPISSQAD